MCIHGDGCRHARGSHDMNTSVAILLPSGPGGRELRDSSIPTTRERDSYAVSGLADQAARPSTINSMTYSIHMGEDPTIRTCMLFTDVRVFMLEKWAVTHTHTHTHTH